MSSSILPDFNTPSLSLGGFTFGIVSDSPGSKPVLEAPLPEPLEEPELGVLGLLENKTFKGKGYNSIFRPRSSQPLEKRPVPGGFNDVANDNDLQLNLTVETMSFSPAIGKTPNRGLKGNKDILLGGITYLDAVDDVTNEATGRGDAEKGTGIHVEPGIWMAVPGCEATGSKATICRMASIPHGTTINAQGLQPSLSPTPGPPTFDKIDITPFKIGSPGRKVSIFNNLDFKVPELNSKDDKGNVMGALDANGNEIGINRIPQNLDKFNGKLCAEWFGTYTSSRKGRGVINTSVEERTITPEIFENPNEVLSNAVGKQKIVNHIKFEVTTESTKDFSGGGTGNIAFLGAPVQTKKDPNKDYSIVKSEEQDANAFVPSVKATFWLETVEHRFSVKAGNPRESFERPAGEYGPTFRVPPTLGRSGDIPFTVNYSQLQYSQTVLLNFFGLSWPHVSVATLSEQTTFNLVLPPPQSGIPPRDPRPENPTSNGYPNMPEPTKPKSPEPEPTKPKSPKPEPTEPGPVEPDSPHTYVPDPNSAEVIGEWEPVLFLKNVAVHATLLPTGKVLYWGRRRDIVFGSMDEHSTDTFLWDPISSQSEPTKSQPILTTGKPVNLFCSAHCLQGDGTVFVIGGHLKDGHGVNQACVYDPFQDTWTPKSRMNFGRWYPSALTLNDGSILAIGGSYYDDTDDSTPKNVLPQIWRNNSWVSMPSNLSIESFPRLHLDPHGRIFMAGTQAQSQFLDIHAYGGTGAWTIDGPIRDSGSCDYGSSVMYDYGKIMVIGGADPPTNAIHFIDLNAEKPSWVASETHMKFPRRQHNSTVLPDGTVLVTGGTRGPGFDNLGNDKEGPFPTHTAELYDPSANPPRWTSMAAERENRCYHSIALLLPDGRVLSAGGGERDGAPSLKNAQTFKPPYLAKSRGPRPTIEHVPSTICYGQIFEVTVGGLDTIIKASWVRLGSVTHSCNFNQSLLFLHCEQQGTKVILTAPADSYVAPPGHYMLFLLNDKGVPSVAPIIRIEGTGAPSSRPKVYHPQRTTRPEHADLSLPKLNEKIIAEQNRPAVMVGLTPKCPYGLGPCWGGASNGLNQISDIDIVRPVPDQNHSTAFVYLRRDIIPDIDVWRREFKTSAHDLYHIRGIEMTLSGLVTKLHHGTSEELTMAGTTNRPEVILVPFQTSSKLEWDRDQNSPKAATDTELGAYERLSAALIFEQGQRLQVTGRLEKHGEQKYSLHVKDWQELGEISIPNGF